MYCSIFIINLVALHGAYPLLYISLYHVSRSCTSFYKAADCKGCLLGKLHLTIVASLWVMYVLQGGEGSIYDLPSCVRNMLQGSAVVSAAPAPFSDSAGQDALKGPPVGGYGWWGTGVLQGA